MELDLDWAPVRNAACASRAVDNETVVVQANRGTVSLLNPVGGEIWKMCDGKTTLKQMLEKLTRDYDAKTDEIIRQVKEFLKESLSFMNGRCVKRKPVAGTLLMQSFGCSLILEAVF